MMRHPGLERLRSFADGELPGERRRRTAAHLADCDRCRTTVGWFGDVRAAAREPVGEPPADMWSRIAARVERGDVVLLPVDAAASGASVNATSRMRALRVAVLALLLAGAAAAALPNGWLRDTIEAVLHELRPAPRVPVDAPPAVDEPSPDTRVMLLVEPRAGAVLISLVAPDAAVRIRVQLVDGTQVEVRALDGAAAARFGTAAGRLTIAEAGAGDVLLAVPRTLERVRIEVDGRVLFTKTHNEIRVTAPSADTIGAEFILPVRSPAHRPQP